MRTALVIGTGLIGTSAALALHARGVQVYLEDHDQAQALTAAALGAGIAEAPPEPVDLAIVAVPRPMSPPRWPVPSGAGRPGRTSTSPASRAARAASWRSWAAT